MNDSSIVDPQKAFLGAGWAFPFAIEPGGAISQAAYETDIKQAIYIILSTNPGERVMRPDFGAGLKAFVFEPANPTTLARLRSRVENSLIAWEPRIDVLEVKVSAPRSSPGRVDISIDYRVRATNSVTNLVYPFYLQEGTPR
ncbi:MAG: baseplate protein [Chloroflexi bacterium]|nr:MAG: baseplate protein [Chloroflexota bacterium]